MGVVLIKSEKIDLIRYQKNTYIHSQIERKGKLWFMRLKKRNLIAE